ncbi:hypothetical protein VTN02DRAFT_5337 [Thermoascus thermophilus]
MQSCREERRADATGAARREKKKPEASGEPGRPRPVGGSPAGGTGIAMSVVPAGNVDGRPASGDGEGRLGNLLISSHPYRFWRDAGVHVWSGMTKTADQDGSDTATTGPYGTDTLLVTGRHHGWHKDEGNDTDVCQAASVGEVDVDVDADLDVPARAVPDLRAGAEQLMGRGLASAYPLAAYLLHERRTGL